MSTSSSLTSFRIGLASLTNNAKFPDAPSFREQLDDYTALPGSPLRAGLQGKDNSGSDYGSFVRGFLEAPEDGTYLFNIASDDNSALFLSTDHTPGNKRLIAFELESGSPLFSGPRQDQRLSAPVNLVRGRKYYFEVLHKQAGGGSYFQVGWQRPDGVQEIIPARHLAQFPVDPFLGSNLANLAPSFNKSGLNSGNLPASVTVAEGSELLVELDVIAEQPTTIEWYNNGTLIPGENLSFFRRTRTSAALNGAKLSAKVRNAFGELVSGTTTVNVTADTTAPAVLVAETGGNPNQLRLTFSEPIDPVAAVSPANYEVRTAVGLPLPVNSITLLPNGQEVELLGAFNFQLNANYRFLVRDIRDRAAVPNVLSPNPTTRSFAFTASQGTTYTFDAGLPSGFILFGTANVSNTGGPDGSRYLELTASDRNRSGTVLLTERRDIDQVRIRFKGRFSDGGATASAPLDPPGDGFSVNIAGDLPLGNLGSAEEGFTPDVPGRRLSFTFDSHPDSSINLPSIGVLLNNQVLTNVLVGTNGVAFNGKPAITSTDGRWVDVDIDLRRTGVIDLTFDGVKILDRFSTPFEVIPSAQISFAARTRQWYQTHWIDDLNINFGEGDIGNVGIASESVLGGTFDEGTEVRLAVLPTGAGPFRYQWLRDGSEIAGATSRLIKFPAVAGAGGRYSVRLSNPFSELTTPPAAVIIRPDSLPPKLAVSRAIAGGVNRIELTFDEALDPASASDEANYTSPLFRVKEVRLGTDGRTVTLSTTPLRVGFSYPISIAGLRDRSTAANVLSAEVNVTPTLTYRDEVLADFPHRYFRLEETSGTVAFSETTSGDQTRTNGAYINLPLLGAPSLVPSDTQGRAVSFVRANTNYVAIPNGGDINDFRGPWPKKTVELWFRAASTPQAGNTNRYQSTAGLYEEGGGARSIHIHLWRDQSKPNPDEAELIFHSFNDTIDGPGTPYGIRVFDPVYIPYTIKTGQTYHVVGVFDGRTDSTEGELRLYVNGELVGRKSGIGQIYNHNGDVRIGSGNARTFFNSSGDFGPFDGVIDEVSLYNVVLSEDRIKARYLAGIGTSLVASNPPVEVVAVAPQGNPNRLSVTFNQPVSPSIANATANYVVRTEAGAVLAIQSAELDRDLVTVRLSGAFNFATGSRYSVTVGGVADILAPENTLASVTTTFGFTSLGPVGIGPASDLGGKQVLENRELRLSVVPSGEPPFRFQWNRNGSPLQGETNAVLAVQAPLGAAGDYTVTVQNEFSSITSPPTRVVVQPDNDAPKLLASRGLAGSLNEIRLKFDEPVDAVSGGNPATYNLGGASVLAAVVDGLGTGVTLKTAPQIHNQRYTLSIAGLRDRAASANAVSLTTQFVSSIDFREEVLSEGPVRYWPFNETAPGDFNTLVSVVDQSRAGLVGVITNAVVGVPGLLTNLAPDTAIQFESANLGLIQLPNARDFNVVLGPWAKRTYLFSIRADKLPRITDATNVASAGIFGEGRVLFYLYATQDTNAPTEAQLVFQAHNNASEGPGTPWGVLSGNPATAKYVATTVRAGETYHVAGVLDGDAAGFSGQLRLYVNGVPAGSVGGVGQLFKHPTPPSFGRTASLRHDGTTPSADYLDGIIDEFSIINRALPADRIAQLYAFAETPPASGGGGTVEDPPLLVARLAGGNIVLTWDGTATLERSDAASGPYTPLPGAVSPASEPVGATAVRFYRLRR